MGATDPPSRPVAHRLRADRVALWGVAACTVVVHALAALLGARLTPGSFSGTGAAYDSWHLFPPSLLRGDLLGSLADLHSQPPGFNLLTALVVRLPASLQQPAGSLVLIGLSVAIATCTLGLLLDLGIRRAAAVTVVVVLVVLDPSQFFYAVWWNYSLLTAALVTATSWAALRLARGPRRSSALWYSVLASALVLTNSTYQLYVLVLASLPILWVVRHQWRRLLVPLLAPLLVVGAWYANDAARFGTFATSSWLGMNLARVTTATDAPSDVRQLVNAGVLSPLAEIRPFSALSAYGALGATSTTGGGPLDATRWTQSPNYNNAAYVAIAKRYLTDDLAWIVHRPHDYVDHMAIGLRYWLIPSDQLFSTTQTVHWEPGEYGRLYDHVFALQPSFDAAGVGINLVIAHAVPPLTSGSLVVLLETALTAAVLPVLAWRRRRREPACAAAALYTWALFTIVFVLTTMVEVGGNNRFRVELGPLPLVGSLLAVAWLLERTAAGRWLRPVGDLDEHDAATATHRDAEHLDVASAV